MEGIIFMVITFIVGMIINAAKSKQQSQKPMPPFNNPTTKQKFELPKQPTIRKSLEDFASEVFDQLNEKAQPKPTAQVLEKHPEPLKAEEIIEKKVESPRISPGSRPAFDGNRSSSRGSILQTNTAKTDPIKDHEIGNIVPTTRAALVQAIITTEILGPPKAKQR